MAYATEDADAGLCGISTEGINASLKEPSISFLHSGQISTSCMYRIRSTLAGIIRSFSLTNLGTLRETISALHQSQWRSAYGTVHKISQTGS